jgi:hypothetical protein
MGCSARDQQPMNKAKETRREVMDGKESVPALRLVIPLPVALYGSNGLLFELYDGGQPYRRHRIVWERLKTLEEQTSMSTSAQRSRD